MRHRKTRSLTRRPATLPTIIARTSAVAVLGLSLAFLLKSISTGQESGGSSPTPEAFAQGALDTIVADLKEEIAAGSTATTVGSGTNTTTNYNPHAPATVVPARVGSTGTGGLENLLKRSAHGQPFYSGANYDTAGHPASDRASGLATSGTSPDGHFVSPARWNKSLLLSKATPASATDRTPVISGSKAFVAPDWVFAAQDGSNPKAWDSGLSVSGTNPVIGRYAYTIYDEGGLLDMNIAGYPSGTPATDVACKSSLAFADLTQLTDLSQNVQLTQTQVDSIVTWRSAQSGTPFTGRQTLIDLLDQTIATGTTSRAQLQNVLRYLGTFSRGLNQPSYIPTQSLDSSKLGYDATAPKILAATSGGNNGTGLDNIINPAFLTVCVTATVPNGRNDGSDLAQGEPLVKKRFALSRLAWLTCKGPSQPRASGSDADIVALKNNGITQAWLEQGTDANIRKYFGLAWDSSGGVWKYNQHNGSGGSGPSGAIMKLDSIAALSGTAAHEPDFFELLKASIKAGSLAKASTLPPSSGYKISHFIAQYETDSRVDDAIIQIGANIIDQFDPDNYPTRISFNDGGGAAKEFRGIENLPYLYRVHPAVVKAVAPTATATGTSAYYADSDTVTTSGTSNVTDTGLGVTFLIPELWNPHDWDDTKLDQTLGAAGPTEFRIYAQSASSVVIRAAYGGYADGVTDSGATTAGVSNGYYTRGFQWTGEARTISAANTAMTFNISKNATGAQLFREPTVLFRQGKPTGSNLAAPALASPSTTNLGNLATVSSVFGGGGIVAAVGDTVEHPLQGQSYIGFYLGTTPLIWKNQTGSTVYRGRYVTVDKTLYPRGVEFGFYLQYKDASGNWATYDEKHVTVGHKGFQYGEIAAPMHQPWAGFLQPTVEGDRHYFVLDPRTSRFGFQTSSISGTDTQRWSFPPFSKSFAVADGYLRWLSRDEGIMSSLRDGWGLGANLQAINNDPSFDLVPYNFPAAMGFYPGNNGNNTSPYWTWNNSAYSFRPGLFSQNTPFTLYADRLNGDSEWIGSLAGNYGLAQPQIYADADGVVRRAMGGWTDKMTQGRGRAMSSWANNYAELMGLPMRRAHAFSTADNKLHKTDIFRNYPPSAPSSSAPLLQTESRPMILNRPFRTVGELGHTFAGTPWKNLNFDMPESGDSALLDVFCMNDTADTNALEAGKVNLNTRQAPVLKAIIAGAYKSETLTSGTIMPVASDTLAETLAGRLVARTSGVRPAGVTISGTGVRPLQNIGELVGRWRSSTYISGLTNPAPPVPYVDPTSYDGFSADIFNPQYFTIPTSKTPNIDLTDDSASPYAIVYDKTIGRRRAAPVRALASAGQTRVWNLMIDVIAQTGSCPDSAAGLADFVATGEQRYWLHVAIDRFTGEVLDQSLEPVPDGSTDISSASILENQPVGTAVGQFSATGSNAGGAFTYALVSGSGSDDNASFAISGDTLTSAEIFQYLVKSTYSIRVRAADGLGGVFEQPMTISILPSHYTQWKIANFQGGANDPAVAGDAVDSDQDGMSNLLEYAVGKSPVAADTPGVTVKTEGGVVKMDYALSSLATDITVRALWTNDLTNPGSWTESGVTETKLSDDGATQLWEATVPVNSEQQVFMRLQVTRP